MSNQKDDFGVLYGQKTTEDALLIYSSYEDAKASPKSGDFIILAPKQEEGVKYLARVEAEIYDEDPIFRNQDKTLIAVHYARIADRELSPRDKQKMFSYTYKVKILGSFQKPNAIDFTTAVRRLPTVSYYARHLKQGEIDNILNRANSKGSDIGFLCIGEPEEGNDTQKIKFDVEKLREKRTMVFAQSGFGKTNLMKVLISNTIANTSYGKLIFDLNGEYYLNGTKTYGLGSIDSDAIRNNLIVYSDKTVETNERFAYKGKVSLNMHKHLSVGDILTFSTGFSEVMKSFLLYLEEEQVEDFIKNLGDYANNPEKLHKKYPDFWKEKDASAGKTIAAIKKRLSFLTEESKGLHLESSTLLEDVFKFLKQGKTVIIDLSLRDNQEATVISNIFMRKLFEHNKKEFTSNNDKSVINTVIVVEEAQNVLSDEFVRSNANPFVRVAKEGRKFGLGLVAITQRPSAISEEIRSQAENFFVLHMGNSKDIKALVESNINYDGVIAKFIQSETIAGNLYMVSANQSFALPIRVIEFEKLIENNVYEALKFKK